jgi:hypothetical protein
MSPLRKTAVFQKRHYYLLAEAVAISAQEAGLATVKASLLFRAFSRCLIGTNPAYDQERFAEECRRVWFK